MTGSSRPSDRPSAAPPTGDEVRAGGLLYFLRLHWFARLRWVFVAFAALALYVETLIVGGFQRPFALVLLVATLALVNVIWRFVSHFTICRIREEEVPSHHDIVAGRAFANAQIAVDLLLLTLIIRHTGGVESPLAIFYVFHMAVASLLLTRTQAILHGLWALLPYSLIAFFELRGWLAPHYPVLPNSPPSTLYAQPAFVLVMTLTVACGVFGTLYLTLDIARRLNEREEALRRSQHSLRALQARRAKFFNVAAHQLKGPLATIQTLAGLIRDEVVSGERANVVCDKIIRRCSEGIEQVSELLTLARVQETEPPRRPPVADVLKVAQQQCDQHADLAASKQIEIRRDFDGAGTLAAAIDPGDLAEVLANLIGNAIKYTPGPGMVTVSARQEPRAIESEPATVSITVADTGMGIDPELLDASREGSVFDAFRRGDNALAAGIPGTGLGLAIVQEVVNQVGGRIRAESEPGHGASFTVSLPAVELEQSSPTATGENVTPQRPVAVPLRGTTS